MDHVVYLDAKAGELEKMVRGAKTMIIRGATGRKMPYGRVNEEDVLYFINNNAEGAVRAKAVVSSVLNSEKLSVEESRALVQKFQQMLQLTDAQFKRWAGKRYLVLIGVTNIERIDPFEISKENYGNMDDWLPVGAIDDVKK